MLEMAAATSTDSPLDSCSPPREEAKTHSQQLPRHGDVPVALESKQEAVTGGEVGTGGVECGDEARLVAAAVVEEELQPRQQQGPPELPLAPAVGAGFAEGRLVAATAEEQQQQQQPRQQQQQQQQAPEELFSPAPAAAPPPLPPPSSPSAAGGGRSSRRIAGGADPVASCPSLAALLSHISTDSQAFQHRGAVLRVKQYLRADAGPREIDAVIESLRSNTRVQALYLQNFELGMGDAQLKKLTEVLKVNRNIWALNVGENFNISIEAWREFTHALRETSVSFLYVSEHHLVRSSPPLKPLMRSALRANRDRLLLEGRVPSAGLARSIKNMWWNPTSWLERLGVGTRVQRDDAWERGGGGGESGGIGGEGENGARKRQRACGGGGKVKKCDKGNYEPTKRTTSRSDAALKVAEARQQRWEELRTAAREQAARKNAAYVERLRIEAESRRLEAERLRFEEEAVTGVREMVARAVERALEAAAREGGGGGGGTGGVAPLAAVPLAFASSSHRAAAAAALPPSSSYSPLLLASNGEAAEAKSSSANAKKKENLGEEKRKRKSEEAAAAAREDERKRRRKKEQAAEEEEERGPPPPPPPPRRRRRTPSIRRARPSELLLPRLGKAVPSGAAVPRRSRLLDGESGGGRRRSRSVEGVLKVLEALLGGEEERRREWRAVVAAPAAAPAAPQQQQQQQEASKEKEAKEPREKKEQKQEEAKPPTELALKRRAAKAERERAAAAAALAAKGGGGGEGAFPLPLPLPLPSEEDEATAQQQQLAPSQPQPALRERLEEAALLCEEEEAEEETAPQLPPPLPLPPLPPAAEQEHQQQLQDKLPFDLDDPLFKGLPDSEWAM